ncbi:hypothetical protein J3R83DRAFT_9794 [Lanmaoa asiatica]|nr:hypothetical protein J3R83DRAFT_9794 [Lanmaoa asiatica]
MSKDSSTFALRNYPDDDALPANDQTGKYPVSWAFSPDIIPLYGAKVDPSTLVDPASWRGFMGMPIVGGEVNNVYIRGYGSGGPYVASLRAFPSELILWPQVWRTVKPVSSGPVVIPGGDTTDASDGPLQFRPPYTTGSTYSLVANVFKHDPANEHKNLEEYEPTPSFDPQEAGVEEFFSFLSSNNTYAFYNVIVADPTLEHVSATTRLRMVGRRPVSVSFRFSVSIIWHEGTPVPHGVQVSLVDDHHKIVVARTPLSPKDYTFNLQPDYDGILTLNIFAPSGNPLFEPYSGLSLQALNGGRLLGALNVIFEPHSTRNLRFASPSATQLRESVNGTSNNPGQDCGPIPVTKPAATGWWFRTAPNDTNNFPQPGPAVGCSPDIQPVGTELINPGLWNDLLDPSIDYSAANSIELVGDSNNYVFVRGHSTIVDIDVQSRLYAVIGNALIHPSQYTKQGTPALVFDGSGAIDQQNISFADANQFYMFNKPFNIKAPPNPNPNPIGGSWGNQPHYCLVAEVRQKRKCSLVYPTWPSEQGEDFATVVDFINWCYTCPLMCFKNICWEPCTPQGQSWDWYCWTQLIIPECSFCCSFWTIIIECDNPVILPGCKLTLKCEDSEIFPPAADGTSHGMCFKIMGCHFTGARPGYSAKLLLCVTWCDGGQPIPPPSIKYRLAMTEPIASPIKHLAADPPAGSEAWPFYVAKQYPYISNQSKLPNPSPLPTFTSAGLNNWPYAGVPQFVVGQVSITAKPESK